MNGKDEEVFEHLPLLGYGIASAAGALTLNLGTVPAGFSWLVERIAIKTSSGWAGAGSFELFAGDPASASNFREGTSSGAQAVADEFQPIRFEQQETLFAVWTGLAALATVVIALQIRVVRPVLPELTPAEGGAEGGAEVGRARGNGEVEGTPSETPAEIGWN